MEQAAANKCYGRDDLARKLGVSLRTADELIATKEIQSFKIKKRRLVTEAAIADFIKRQEKAAR